MPFEAISLTRVVGARRERVFEAWTRPELMARWLMPDPRWTTAVESELRVGGRYRLRMRESDGKEHLQFGEYLEILPVSRRRRRRWPTAGNIFSRA